MIDKLFSTIYLFINLKSEKIFKEKSFNISNPNDPNYPNNIEKYLSLADLLNIGKKLKINYQ